MTFDLRAHTVLLAVAGSRAYGLHRAESDVDVRGVAVPPAAYFHGFLRRFDQADSAEEVAAFEDLLRPEERLASARTRLEGSVYDLRKLVRLAADCNPNLLDVLFCRDDEVRLASSVGRRLRAERRRFLSARAKQTYSGYAASQLQRIRGHRKWLLDPPTHRPTRAEFGLPEHTLLPADQLAAANAAVGKALPDADHADDDAFRGAAGRIGLDDNLVYVMVQERAYASAARQYRQYEEWRRKRNPARAALEERHGYDTKHAAHLVRLLRMGREILTTGEVHVWRGEGGGGDRDELLAVRDGAWAYDALVAWAEREEAELEALVRSGTLAVPPAPDLEALDALCVGLVEEALGVR